MAAVRGRRVAVFALTICWVQSFIPSESIHRNLRLHVGKHDPGKISKWDEIKSFFYGSLDALIPQDEPDNRAMKIQKPPIEYILQPMLGKTQSQKDLPSDIRKAYFDLQTGGILERTKAKWKINDWKRRQGMENVKRVTTGTAMVFREGFYKVGDVVESSVSVASTFPSKVSNSVNKTQRVVDSIPTKIQRSVDMLVCIPERTATATQQTIEGTKRSYQQTVETTKLVIQDIQSIPARVSQTYQDIQAIPGNVTKKLQDTKAYVQQTTEQIREITFQSKVLLGLERPRPKPPKMPPPMTPREKAQQIGWKVAKTAATGTGKVAWWVGKGAVWLTWKGTQSAFQVVAPKVAKRLPTIEIPSGERLRVDGIDQSPVQSRSERKVSTEQVLGNELSSSVKTEAMVMAAEPLKPKMSTKEMVRNDRTADAPSEKSDAIKEYSSESLVSPRDSTNDKAVHPLVTLTSKDQSKGSSKSLVPESRERGPENEASNSHSSEETDSTSFPSTGDSDLDREVAEALRLAEEALNFYKKKTD